MNAHTAWLEWSTKQPKLPTQDDEILLNAGVETQPTGELDIGREGCFKAGYDAGLRQSEDELGALTQERDELYERINTFAHG